MSAEYLAKAYFSKQGYLIQSPDCHETNYDFVAIQDGISLRVQVKAVIEIQGKFNIARIRNKHAKNKLYLQQDYDVLAGVWVERNRIYLFKSEEVNENSFGESITVSKLDERLLSSRKRPVPYFEGDI